MRLPDRDETVEIAASPTPLQRRALELLQLPLTTT